MVGVDVRVHVGRVCLCLFPAALLPLGHPALHAILKVAAELKEVRCTLLFCPGAKRNLSTLGSHSALVTQALAASTHTHTHTDLKGHTDRNLNQKRQKEK